MRTEKAGAPKTGVTALLGLNSGCQAGESVFSPVHSCEPKKSDTWYIIGRAHRNRNRDRYRDRLDMVLGDVKRETCFYNIKSFCHIMSVDARDIRSTHDPAIARHRRTDLVL